MTAALVAVVVLFAWNLGAHYTGATMGMPYAAGAVSLWPALAVVAVFSLLGATFASGRVERTVGEHLVPAPDVRTSTALVIVAAAGALTMLFNYLRLPTSTIQILVFCVLGAAVAAHLPVDWATLGRLVLVWVAAPLGALALGFAFTRGLDLVVPRLRRLLPLLLVAVGVCASFALGGNDVANATGALILVHLVSLREAGAIGGAAMLVGALTWGRRILDRVAFDVVRLDLAMASAAQGVQALVILLAVAQGYFTSMNQALIAAMAGAGLARGRQTVDRAQLTAILRGWLIGPAAGFALAYAVELLARSSG
ncbi:MAG TPA: anion permease [Gaiellaceae bacterium]|nr:anion permease [Gaiellaceae bacterium]